MENSTSNSIELSSKDTDEEYVINSRSNSVEIIICEKADKVINKTV